MSDSLPAHRKRVLLKLSGAALATDTASSIDFQTLDRICEEIKTCTLAGTQIIIVVGGSNLWPSIQHLQRTESSIALLASIRNRTRYEHIGMLATTINALALADLLEGKGLDVRVQTAISMQPIAEPYIRARALHHLDKDRIVVIGAGTGNPYFSTDVAATLRAAELNAEVVLLGKGNDYFQSLGQPLPCTTTYDRALADRHTMDTTAAALAQSSHLPTLIFPLQEPDSIINAVNGRAKGVIVY